MPGKSDNRFPLVQPEGQDNQSDSVKNKRGAEG
jgi:hypothetical protein